MRNAIGHFKIAMIIQDSLTSLLVIVERPDVSEVHCEINLLSHVPEGNSRLHTTEVRNMENLRPLV